MKKVIKKIGRPLKKTVLRSTNSVGSVVLRHRVLGRMLNNMYEKRGPAFSAVLNKLLDEPALQRKTTWRCRFNGRVFSLPLLPDLPRSWSNARFWKWSGAAQPRAFYEWYLRHRKPAAILDIGANDGMHSYPFAAHGWRCFCFEPQPSCVAYINETCRLNKFSRVQTLQCLVGEEEAPAADFFVSNSSWFSSRKKENVERFEEAELIQVQSITVDGFCAEQGIEPAFIKIDVEGFEWEVLQGSLQTLEKFQPELSIEIDCDDSAKKRKIWELLQPLGYRFYQVGEQPGEKPRRVEDVKAFLTAGENRLIVDYLLLANPQIVAQFESDFLAGRKTS